MAKEGTVNIHGKDYITVAKRVNDFRELYKQEFSLETEIISADELIVVMKASIRTKDGFIVATGHAEEVRTASMINKTSALENCETSAIGRALASLGLAGTEFASANEVQQAIANQSDKKVVDAYQSPRKATISNELVELKTEILAKYKESGKDASKFKDFLLETIGLDEVRTVADAKDVLEALKK
jgi:hypothetical protein